MLCRKNSSCEETGSVPVYLNVYDLTPINGYAYWFGLGVYHSGVQGLFSYYLLLSTFRLYIFLSAASFGWQIYGLGFKSLKPGVLLDAVFHF